MIAAENCQQEAFYYEISQSTIVRLTRPQMQSNCNCSSTVFTDDLFRYNESAK